MNTDAQHSGKAHSTHGFTRASADIRRNTTTRHSTVAHTVTASETQHGYTRSHRNRTEPEHTTIQILLNNGEHNTNADTGGWTSCKVRK